MPVALRGVCPLLQVLDMPAALAFYRDVLGFHIASAADTALFLGCPDLDAADDHLRAHGLDVAARAIAPYGMRQLFLRDPVGG